MGNCFACFKDHSQAGSERHDGTNNCKYQATRTTGDPVGNNSTRDAQGIRINLSITNKDAAANYNNNYPSSYPPALQNRGELEPSETEGLLGPATTFVEDTKGHTITTTGGSMSDNPPSSNSNYGIKLLKKPMISILNGNLSSSTSSNKESRSSGKQGHLQISDNKINALFETYREERDDAILATGIERLCSDLRYKPEDFAVLVLAWRLDASQMCRFTKTEFIQGLHTLNADSIEMVRLRLEEEVVRLQGDKELFKNLYRFTFRFGLEPDLRTLPLDMAISLWRLVFTMHTPDILVKWLDYLAENPQQIRGISKDTWNIFLNFADSCDIYSYSDEDAWPSVFDDFVEYENERRKEEEQAAGIVLGQQGIES